jgi:hypothetical protein
MFVRHCNGHLYSIETVTQIESVINTDYLYLMTALPEAFTQRYELLFCAATIELVDDEEYLHITQSRVQFSRLNFVVDKDGQDRRVYL